MAFKNFNDPNDLIQQKWSGLEISSQKRNFGFTASSMNEQDSGNNKLAVSPNAEALKRKFTQIEDQGNTLSDSSAYDNKNRSDDEAMLDDIDVQLVKPKKKDDGQDKGLSEKERAIIISKSSGIIGGEG